MNIPTQAKSGLEWATSTRPLSPCPLSPLTSLPAFCSITRTSSLFIHLGSGPEFHAEWLRDEPYDATATDPRSYIPGVWCQLSPGNREHGIRHARCICIPIASFPFPGKRGLCFLRPLFQARPQLLAALREQNRKARKRVARCLTTNCGAGNADGRG